MVQHRLLMKRQAAACGGNQSLVSAPSLRTRNSLLPSVREYSCPSLLTCSACNFLISIHGLKALPSVILVGNLRVIFNSLLSHLPNEWRNPLQGQHLCPFWPLTLSPTVGTKIHHGFHLHSPHYYHRCTSFYVLLAI